MNHLRELIDQYNKQKVLANPSLSSDAIKSIAKVFEQKIESAVCFWIGDLASLNGLRIVPELCQLPYGDCWFESSIHIAGQHAHVGAFVTNANDMFTMITFLREQHGNWVLQSAASMNSLTTEEFGIAPNEDASKMSVLLARGAIAAFLSALNCSNVSQHETSPDARLQAARRKRGKAPLFSYWTLHLGSKSERGEPLGGTHSSPRVHLRMGHPRVLPSGRGIWVKAHMVGNKKLGMVHKDYAVTPSFFKKSEADDAPHA